MKIIRIDIMLILFIFLGFWNASQGKGEQRDSEVSEDRINGQHNTKYI